MERLSLNKTFLGVTISAVIASGAYAETVNEAVDSKQFSKKSALETEDEIVDTELKSPFSTFSRGQKAQSHLVNPDLNNTLSFLKEQGLLETNEQKVTIVKGDNTHVKSDLLISKVFASANCTLPGGACTTISSSSCTLRGGTVGACGASPEIDVEESGSTTTSENFGSVAANGVATTTKTFTVKNEGSGNLTTSSVSITSGGSDFSITGGTCATNGQTLTSGMQCTILVTVQTSTIGALVGNLRVSSNDANEGMYNISLSATGTDATAPTFSEASSTPTDNATNVSVSDNIVIDFSENVALGTGNITVRDVTGSSDFEVFNVATQSDDATTSPSSGRIGIVNDKIYINPTSSLTGSNQYSVRVDSTAVDDSAGNSFVGISDDTTFNFTTINAAPVVDLNSGTSGNDTTASFSEGSGAVSFMTSPTVTDTDTITTITVSLTNDQDGASEGLNVSASAQNALTGISGASDITLQDTLSITGATATTAEVAAFLQAVTYNNTSSTPDTTSRTVSVVVNDGTDNSASRSAVISVANVTAASTTGASFNTTSGANLSPAISFSSDNETLTIASVSHIVGSTAQGGSGTDEIVVIDGSDLTQFTSLTTFETLSTYNNGSLTLSESQHDTFTTINGTGTNTFTLASADGDSTVIADADIETYVLNAAFNITLSSAAQNITGSGSADTVNIAGLSVTGTLAGGGGTDILQMSTGANISNATVSAFESLTLSSGASVTMTEAQHDSFTTITASGADSITISTATDGLTGSSVVETYVLSAANTFTLGSASQNLTGSGGDDTVNVNALSATGTLAGGSGTDTLVVTNGGNISGATVSGFEDLSVAAGGTVTVGASQLTSFTGTVSGSGTETIAVSGDGNVSTVSAIESYTLNDDSTNTRSVTVTSASHSVTAASATDAITFDLGTLAFTGTITGDNTVADTLSLSNGANISAGTISNISNLTLASGASVNMTASQHNAFNGTITAPGSETIVISGDGNVTTYSSVESYSIGDDSTNTRTVTLSNGTTNVTATSTTDVVTFDIGSNAFSGTLTGDASQTDRVSASNGADVSGGSYFNIGSLSLSSGATVAIDAANISDFSTSITGGAGSEILKVMDGGTFNFSSTSASSIEGIAIGTNSNFALTLTDNFASDGGAVDITNTTGSAITGTITLDASAFSGDVLTISATDLNGSDTFTGGSGADTIRPGGGTDSMTGNGGNDNFIGSTSDLSGDTIADLSIGDMITLTGVTGLSTNNVRFNGSSALEVDTDATDFNISELTLSLTNAPSADLAFTVADSGANTVITFIASNEAPAFSSLNGGATYTENGNAVTIDSDVTVADAELDALSSANGNYNDATLTIERNGGANSEDIFSNQLLLGTLVQGSAFTYNGTPVGTVTTNSAGTLVLTFNSNATSSIVDSVLQSIGYSNSSESPASSVTLNFTFNDGTADSTGTNQAVVNITAQNDAPTDISLSATSVNQSSTGPGANIGSLTTSDVDTSDSHSYSLVSTGTSVTGTCSADTGNASFQINGSILQTQAALSAGSYIVCLQTNDTSTTFQKSFTITVADDVAPNAPSTPDLDTASDSGPSSTDNITNDNTPTLSGTAESGTTVALYSNQVGGGATVIGTGTATGGNWQITTSELTSGLVHAISAKATDSNSNESSRSSTLNVTIDTTAPSAPSTPDLDSASDSGSSSTDNITNDSTPTFTGSGTTGDTITLISSIDGSVGSVIVSGGVWSITPGSALTSGSHTIVARATDSAGNTLDSISGLSVTIDTSAATPSISTPIESDDIVNAAEDNDVLIVGAGAEANTSVTVQITDSNSTVSRSVTADGSGNWTLSGQELDVSSLNNGSLTVSATQQDEAGNTSNAATETITLDNAAPSALSITAPIETDGIVNAAEDSDVLIVGTGAEANNSVTVQITDSNSTVSRTVTADSSGNWTLSGQELDVSSLNNGSLTVSATQQDAAGNTSTVATTSITLDNQTPNSLTITTPIETDGVVNDAEDGDVLIQGGGAESGATVTVDVGGVSTTTTADSSGNWTLSGNELDISALNNGTLTVSATQADSAGNTSTATTTTISLDNQAPNALTITTPIEGDGKVNSSEDNDVLVQGSGAESGATVTVSIDGVTKTTTADSSGNWTLSGNELDISALNNGTLTVSATQADSAGNTSTATTTTISLDNQAPNALTITTPIETDGVVNAAEDADVLIQGGGAESGATVTVDVGGVSTTTTADSSGNWTLSGNELDISALNNGTLTVSATQADSAGNTSTATTTTISLDNQAPNALTITTPIETDGVVNAAEDGDVSIQGGGAESGATVTVSIDGVTKTTTADSSGNWTLSGNELDISALNNGTLTVSATQADSAGNTSTATTTTISLDNQAPNALTITTPIEGDGKVNASEDNDVLVQGSGAESGATVTVSIDGVTKTTTADSSGNWTLSGNELDISALNNGTLTVSVTQADSAGNTSTATTTTISLDNQAPNALTITTPIETDGIVNAAEDGDVLITGSGAEANTSVTVTISDGANNQLRTVTADGSGAWTLSGSEFDVSSFNNGSLSISATQTDAAGNTSTAATSSITLDNAAPNAVAITTPIEGDDKVSAVEDGDVLIIGSGAEADTSVTVTISDGANNQSRTVTADGSGAWTLSGSEFDVTSFNNGTLSVSATQTDAAGNTSTAATATITLDNSAPSAVSITTPIEGDGKVNAAEDSDVLITGSGAEADTSVTVTISDGANSDTRTVTADGSGAWTLSGSEFDVSTFNNGTLTVNATQTDSAGNTSSVASTSVILDNVAPTGTTAAFDQSIINRSNEAALSFTLSGLESSGSFTYQISDGSSTVSSQSAVAITSNTEQVTSVNVTNLNEGTLTLTAIVTDESGNPGTGVTATVTKQYNVVPVLSGNPTTSINEDSVYSFIPTLTDSDSEDTHTYSITNKPTWASFDTQTGELSGTPTDEHVGTTSNIQISVDDGTDTGNLTAFNIEVVNTNDAPTGQNTSYTINEGGTLSRDFNNGLLTLAADDDLDSNDSLTIAKDTDPQHGSLTLNSNGSFSYVHDGSENLTDSFTYHVEDSESASSSVYTVTINMNAVEDAPTAFNDSILTLEDESKSINVLSNDSDPESNLVASSVTVKTQPTKGQLSIANGVVTFTPNSNVNGSDSFTYTVKDSTLAESNEAIVNIDITPVNDAPIVSNFNEMVDEDTATNAIQVRGGATDIEDTIPTGDIAVVAQPAKGSVSIDQNDGTLIYTPAANENGQDTFTYTIADSEGLASNTATVTINIGAVNDRPVVVDDAVTTDEDTATSIAILTNDSDVEDQGFNGANVLLEDKGDGVGEYSFASVSVNADGSLAITPKTNINGVYSFTYTVTDSEGLASEAATVTLTINAINDAPVALDNTAQLQEEGQFEVNVLGNDSDVDEGDSLDVSSVTVVSDATNGQTSVTNTGAIIYTANANFFGNDSFTYTVKDSQGAVSNVATVTMTVTSVNDKPVASAQAQTLDEDGSILLTLVATDVDQDT
ncbi:Ig-like domain-containing protein, partial [Pseudoalteromonas sp. H105]|uniref:Ig-like domain-containing protein n=1 Tax=Pseudoalteromonas sp. H105 TaxID=1348393 RepID=UPI0007321A10